MKAVMIMNVTCEQCEAESSVPLDYEEDVHCECGELLAGIDQDETTECEDCENWKQRGDDLFDELDRTNNEYSGLADRLRTRDDEIARLQKLLTDNGIDFQEDEDGL